MVCCLLGRMHLGFLWVYPFYNEEHWEKALANVLFCLLLLVFETAITYFDNILKNHVITGILLRVWDEVESRKAEFNGIKHRQFMG